MINLKAAIFDKGIVVIVLPAPRVALVVDSQADDVMEPVRW